MTQANHHVKTRRRVRRRRGVHRRGARERRGAATLDYVLVICVALPMITFVVGAAPRIMNLVYEMTCVLVGSPFQ